MQLLERCQFVQAHAEDLSVIRDDAVDVVTTRSVLIYVAVKQKAFCEFHRVLKPGGRLSIFEPINRFAEGEPDHLFGGYDVTPVAHLSRKIKSVYEHLQPMHSDPMMDFDERDLVKFAEQAGFSEIHLELQIAIQPITEKRSWEIFIQSPPNPKVPSAQEAMQQVLSAQEIEQFTACLRPLVEQGNGVHRGALAYLWAVK
jgi:SAM-dependent methyltransferase